jgi:hypothetical protein
LARWLSFVRTFRSVFSLVSRQASVWYMNGGNY